MAVYGVVAVCDQSLLSMACCSVQHVICASKLRVYCVASCIAQGCTMQILVAYLLTGLHGIQTKIEQIYNFSNHKSPLGTFLAVEFCIIQEHYLGPIESLPAVHRKEGGGRGTGSSWEGLYPTTCPGPSLLSHIDPPLFGSPSDLWGQGGRTRFLGYVIMTPQKNAFQ